MEQKIRLELENISRRAELLCAVKITYPPQLPVSHEVEKIKAAIINNQVTIICGETGSGKTTQLPKILLELGYGLGGLIGHTQPRRIAAKSLAARISSELGFANQEQSLVGYKMRFHDRTSRFTAIKLMTDGILLQEIQQDRLLLQYSALVIDEVHERSLNIDFILGYLKQLIVRRPDLKIIITSATLENEKLAKFFNNIPVINVTGKTYPVDIIYQPLNEDKEELDLKQGIYHAINAALSVLPGNGLVFLPGEREIKDCLGYLRKTELKQYELLALYSKQNNQEQSQIFADNGRLKIILATNIAETSLTIPGIKFVIDSGIARVKRYSIRNKVEQLQLEDISQASGQQRAGRAGRVSQGFCVRLYSEQEFKLRKPFTEPELLRSNLANVILKLLSLNLGDPLNFPFLDMPENKAYNDGFRTLFQLEAIDHNNCITRLGRKLAQIPIDIQLARVLLAASEDFNCLHEALIITSFLAIQDPREFPLEQQALANERHSIWADKESEFIQILNLWQWYHHELEHKKSNRKLLEVCHKQFVSLLRLKEWHELHRQLKETMLGLGYKENMHPATYQELHTALLSGFALNIGQKDLAESYYIGTHSKKFYLHPAIKISGAKWIVAANMVETSRLYARNCAKIEPQWLNKVASHLYKYTYHGEQWDKKRGEATAIKSALLFGLLIQQERVSISKINPKLAQEIFIKEGLVQNQLHKKYSFTEHNLQVIKAVQKMEDKLRTSLFMLDDELYTFYAAKLFPQVIDIPSLEQFLKIAEDSLKIDQAEFIERLTKDNPQLSLFPESIINNEQKLQLKYIFDHDSDEDGLVIIIQLSQLSLVKVEQFAWLVPGMIRDKLTFMIKSLPKSQRLQFNPLEETITEFLDFADSEQNLYKQFIIYAKQYKSISLNYMDLLAIKLPTQLRPHFRVLDNKKLLTSGDDLEQIKVELTPVLDKLVIKYTHKEQINNLTGFIPEFVNLLQEVRLNPEVKDRLNFSGTIRSDFAGAEDHKLTGYYSLIVEKDGSVAFGVAAELNKARLGTKRGLIYLIRDKLKDQLKYLQNKKIGSFTKISFALIDIYSQDELALSISNYIVNLAITKAIGDKLPVTEVEFNMMINQSRANVSIWTSEVSTALAKLAEYYQQVKLKINGHPLQEIINLQLEDLIYPEFLSYTKWQFLSNFPRYLQAVLLRLDKYSKAPGRDEALEDEIRYVYDKWYNYVDELENKHKAVSSELYAFKYKIEELRISLFAQEVRTLYPVSSKRLLAELEDLYYTHLEDLHIEVYSS